MKRADTAGMLSMKTCCLAIITLGCQNARQDWDGRVHQWGTMREVLAQGKSQGRIRLIDAVGKPHAFGIGALEKLSGEITIVNGDVWLAQSEGSTIRVNQSNKSRGYATLLTIAYVPNWRATPMNRELASDEIESFVLTVATERGLPVDKPFPFLITGPVDVDAHVIHGSCPHFVQDPGVSVPALRCNATKREGTVVGFFAEKGGGSLTHHGERTHMHVVFDPSVNCAGHIDRLRVHPEATLFVP